MFTKNVIAGAIAALATTLGMAAHAHEDRVPGGIPELDHVFVIMMENHGIGQILNNPNEAYLNGLIASGAVSYATNFFAVGHPSLTNYLEIVGGSNFGIRSDHYPLWHSKSCVPNLASRTPNEDNSSGTAPYAVDTGRVCPIDGAGFDAATEAVDDWNEVSQISATGVVPVVYNHLANFDGIKSLAAAKTDGITIADQLARAGRSWKTYQESLPFAGADNVDYSNGTATQSSNFKAGSTGSLAPLTTGSIVAAYAAKHNPFVYFKAVQEGSKPGMSFDNIVGFDGPKGLYADLATGRVPAFSFIAPNQCNDQHGRGNADAFCGYDTSDAGTQAGLNPGLIAQGDATIQRLVTSIKASKAWHEGESAIVIIWDENDYSGIDVAQAPGTLYPAAHQNNVLVTVETNYRSSPNVASAKYYTHFSLLKSIEAGLGLPCLNHACDKDVSVMSDMFAR